MGIVETTMAVYRIDPLADPRWDALVQQHANASIFHTRGWLEALRQTYGYKPLAFTTSRPDRSLEDGLAFCEVSGWLCRRRLVSLPFSDHCAPLVDSSHQLTCLLTFLQENFDREKWSQVEVRGLSAVLPSGTDF